MPNRREPVTKQADFRKGGWAQDRTLLNKNGTYHRNIDGSSSALINSDFEFRCPNGKRLDYTKPIIIDDVSTVRLTW